MKEALKGAGEHYSEGKSHQLIARQAGWLLLFRHGTAATSHSGHNANFEELEKQADADGPSSFLTNYFWLALSHAKCEERGGQREREGE